MADAVGHCLLVFAFLPTLAAIPQWLWFELQNALNVQDPVVLAFVPVRGFVSVLSAFGAGVVPGVMGGTLNGVLVTAWVASRGVPTGPRRLAVGGLTGGLASGLMVLAVTAAQLTGGGPVTSTFGTVAFEVASGIACGMVATPTAIRLLLAGSSEPHAGR